MKVTDVMTPDVLTVGPETSVGDAATLMVERRVSGLPVVDGSGKLVGIFTEGDLLRRAEMGTGSMGRSRWMEFLLGTGRSAEDYVLTHSRRVGDLMKTDLITVTEDATLQDVVNLMESKRIRRVPVVRGDKLVGIVSRRDLVRLLARKLAEMKPPTGSDAQIEQRLKEELSKQPWVAANSLSVSLKDGVVTLDGLIFDERCREALHVLAQNVTGATKVVDNLVWTDPNTGMMIPASV